MIRRSDSVAATVVRDRLGRRRIERLATVARMRDLHPHPVSGMSLTSPRDQARFMFRLDSYVPAGTAPTPAAFSHTSSARSAGASRESPLATTKSGC